MKLSVLILLMGLLAGCSATKQTIFSEIPSLLIQYPLPDVTPKIYRPDFSINIMLLIDKTGSVERVKLLSTSGDSLWDAKAEAAIKKWKYTPAKINNKPVQAWIKQTALLEFLKPVYMNLGEILCENKSVADSVYSALNEGIKFGILAKEFSVAPSAADSGYIGTVNINQYSRDIRWIIGYLDINGYTEPMKFGNNFLIIKRYNH